MVVLNFINTTNISFLVCVSALGSDRAETGAEDSNPAWETLYVKCQLCAFHLTFSVLAFTELERRIEQFVWAVTRNSRSLLWNPPYTLFAPAGALRSWEWGHMWGITEVTWMCPSLHELFLNNSHTVIIIYTCIWTPMWCFELNLYCNLEGYVPHEVALDCTGYLSIRHDTAWIAYIQYMVYYLHTGICLWQTTYVIKWSWFEFVDTLFIFISRVHLLF